jgi:hypothetical protein
MVGRMIRDSIIASYLVLKSPKILILYWTDMAQTTKIKSDFLGLYVNAGSWAARPFYGAGSWAARPFYGTIFNLRDVRSSRTLVAK